MRDARAYLMTIHIDGYDARAARATRATSHNRFAILSISSVLHISMSFLKFDVNFRNLKIRLLGVPFTNTSHNRSQPGSVLGSAPASWVPSLMGNIPLRTGQFKFGFWFSRGGIPPWTYGVVKKSYPQAANLDKYDSINSEFLKQLIFQIELSLGPHKPNPPPPPPI